MDGVALSAAVESHYCGGGVCARHHLDYFARHPEDGVTDSVDTEYVLWIVYSM